MKVLKAWMTCMLVVFSICILLSSGAYAQRTIVLAVDGDWPPMKMKDANGNVIGYEIEIIKAIGTEGDFQVKIIEVPWENIFRDLDAGKFDAIIASVSITGQRKEKFDFSTPYFSAEQLLVIPNALLDESLKGKTIAAFEATTGADELKKSGLVHIKLYPSSETEGAFKDLAEGKIDGILCDTPVAINYAFYKDVYKMKFAICSSQPVLGKPSGKEDYGIVVKKGNAEVLNLVNKGIKAVKNKGIDYQIRAHWIKW